MNGPQHTPIEHWPVIDDCLVVGGMPLPRLAARAGRTPFYVYDRQVVDARLELLRQHLPREVKLHYALKANPMPALACHIAPRVDGFDVASGAELKTALDTGIAAAAVSFAGPGKSELELRQAIASGVLVNVESLREIEILARLSRETGAKARVAIRVNPDFELKSSGMSMGGGPKQFGIDAERVPEVLAAVSQHDLGFEGLHIFTGSQNLSAPAICEAQRSAVDLAMTLAGGTLLRTINIGGGLGIPYFPGDQALDLAPIGANLRALESALHTHHPDATLVVELGRYIVGEAGLYVCRVVERKISRDRVYLITDGGMHHHLAASGNFGQIIRKNYPVVIGNRVRGTKRETASVVGPLCTPLDLLADRMDLAEAKEGDLVAVFHSGAYGLTASPTAFLGHPPPLELLV